MNLSDPQSSGRQQIQQILSKVPIDQLRGVFAQAAGKIGSQEYRQEAVGMLSKLGPGALSMIAGLLVKFLGPDMGKLAGMIPGLRSTEPNQMDASEVASVADYARENRPEVFGQVAATIGQKDPGLLQGLLGNKVLGSAMSMLAQKLMH